MNGILILLVVIAAVTVSGLAKRTNVRRVSRRFDQEVGSERSTRRLDRRARYGELDDEILRNVLESLDIEEAAAEERIRRGPL